MPDPELDMFTSTTKYTWQEVADSDELGQFLTEVRCGVRSSGLGRFTWNKILIHATLRRTGWHHVDEAAQQTATASAP